MVAEMQADKKPTAGKVLPQIAHIWRHLRILNDGEDAHRMSLATAAIECFHRKIADLGTDLEPPDRMQDVFGRMNSKWICISAYLDPFAFDQLEAIYEISPRFANLRALVPHFVSTELAKLPKIDHHQPARAQIPGQLFERRRPPHTGAMEMAAYENLPAEEFENITDALDFWRKNDHHFPMLAQLARRFLSVPASSAPSERAFKELRSVLGDFTRNRLNPTRTASLIFMRSQYLNKL